MLQLCLSEGTVSFLHVPSCLTKMKVLVTNHLQNPQTPLFSSESLFSFAYGSTSEGVTSLFDK